MAEEDITYLKTLVKGAGLVFLGMVVSKILSYISRIFIARYFGPGDYGLFSIGIAVLGFFTTFAVLGLQTGVIRYTTYYKTKNDERRVKGVIKSAIKIVLVASVVMTFAMFVSAQYLAETLFGEPGLGYVLRIFALSIPFSAIFAITISVFTGFKKIKYSVYSESIFFNVMKLVFVITFGVLGLGVAGMAWAWDIAAVLSLALSAYFLLSIYPRLKTRVESIEMKREILSYSFPLLMTATMSFVIMWTDTLMIGAFKDAFDVGIYNAAMPTAQLLIIFPNALLALFMPIITEIHTKGKASELKKVYKRVTQWIFYIDFPLFLSLVFFSGYVLKLLFGPEYMDGSAALVILSVGMMFRKTAQGQMSHLLQTFKKTRFILYIAIISTVSNISLNYTLIPVYGFNGAAMATTMTYILAFSFYYIFSYKVTGLSPFSRNMMKSVVAGVISIALAYAVYNIFPYELPMYVMAGIFVAFMLLYLLILLLLRGFDGDDIEMVKVMERKSGMKLGFVRRIIRKLSYGA